MEERICAVCFALPATVRFAGKACQHGFCDGCASQSLAAILDTDQFPAACPGCLAEEATGVDHDDNTLIQSEVIERLVRRAVVTLQFARRFINLQIMKAFNSDDIITCPSCGVLSVCPDMTGKVPFSPFLFAASHHVVVGLLLVVLLSFSGGGSSQAISLPPPLLPFYPYETCLLRALCC